MSLRHVVFIRLDEDTPQAKVTALVDGLRRLPEVIDSVESYEVGTDLGLSIGAPDITVVARFADMADFDAYRAHPEHLRLVEELLEPIGTRVSSQFHTDAT